MNIWRISSRLIAALILIVGPLACGGARNDAQPSAGGEGEAPPPASENNINAMPRDRVQDGGRLTWPIESMPVHYNYSHLDGTEADHSYSKLSMLPRIFMADAAGNPIWNPDYLASAPVMVPDPKQVITYNINPKAIWYDGTPITWEDFHWYWRARNGTNKAYQISSSTGYEDIESVVRGRDDREVVVTFKNKVADWQALFYGLLPASTGKDPKVFNEGWRQRPLTTAGPFKLGSIDQTAKTVTLVRNEKWWGRPAKLDAIVFRTIETDAQIDALANGEIDLMDIGPDVNKFSRAKGIAGADIRFAGGPNFRHVTINGTGEILKDVKVRQAIAMAIDRAVIARALLGPLGIEPVTLGNHIFMRNQAGYRDNSGEIGKYNPTRAAQLLDEACWTLDGKVRKKGGRILDINCVIPAAVATSRQESELIQNMLGQIGVRLAINTVPSQDYFEKYIRPGQYDMTMFSWLGTPYPIASAKGLYSMPKMGPDGVLAIQQNYARVGTEEIDRLFDQATQELDRTRAIELANQIDAKIWEIVHSLTLYQRPEMWVTKSGLANHGAFGFAEIAYEDIGWAKR